MTEINNHNGAWLPDDEEGDHCYACNGRGGNVSSQDPVGDGGGSETLFDACPNCIGAGKCPGCMGPLAPPEPNDPYICLNACGWDAAEIDRYDDEPDYDYEPY